MLNSKSGTWWEKHPYRARANISAVMVRADTTQEEFNYVFDKCIASNAGEPGVYWTNSTEVLSNPCFHKDTLIITDKGPKPIKTLVGKEVTVMSRGKWVTINNFSITGKNAAILSIKIKSGAELKVTAEHTIILDNGIKIKAKDLKIGDSLLPCGSKSDYETSYNVVSDIFWSSVEDEVYCCTVPNTNSIALAIGIEVGQCAEISLRNNGFCNLTTINQTGVTSKKDFLNRVYSASLIGTLQAAYTNFPYLSEAWQTTAEQDALLGVSFTGVADANNTISSDWLQEAAKLVLEVNQKYARKIGINEAKRTTCLKPEGSSSLVFGSSSGIHARHSKYYLRRIRMNKSDALAHYLSNTIPELVEEDKFSPTTVVITIPQQSPDGAITRADETAITLMNRVLFYYENWIRPGHVDGVNTHSVSVTINYKPEEVEELKSRMWNDRYSYAGISLLPYSDHTYVQAPFEECDEAKFNEFSEKMKDVDLKNVVEEQDNTNRSEISSCEGGLCLIS